MDELRYLKAYATSHWGSSLLTTQRSRCRPGTPPKPLPNQHPGGPSPLAMCGEGPFRPPLAAVLSMQGQSSQSELYNIKLALPLAQFFLPVLTIKRARSPHLFIFGPQSIFLSFLPPPPTTSTFTDRNLNLPNCH